MICILFLLVLTNAHGFVDKNYGLENYYNDYGQVHRRKESSLDYSDDILGSSYLEDVGKLNSLYLEKLDDSPDEAIIVTLESEDVKKCKTTDPCKKTTCKTTCAVSTNVCDDRSTDCTTPCAHTTTCPTTCSTTCSTTCKSTTCKKAKTTKCKKKNRKERAKKMFNKLRIRKPGQLFQLRHQSKDQEMTSNFFDLNKNNSFVDKTLGVVLGENETSLNEPGTTLQSGQKSDVANVYRKLADDFRSLQTILSEPSSQSNLKSDMESEPRSKMMDKNSSSILTIEDVVGVSGPVTRITLVRRSVSEKTKNVDIPNSSPGEEMKLRIQTQDDDKK